MTAICVFAKPPAAGISKTRLAATLGPERAARFAAAFLVDTWRAVTALPWATPIVATTELAVARVLPGATIWLQGDGDLGTRIERVMTRAIAEHGAAIALGADTPGLPLSLLEAARDGLAHHDAVLGPCDDGGFYLLGLRTLPPGLLGELPWSDTTTCQRTHERLRARGLTVATLPRWFDVDHADDLEKLRALVRAREVDAPATRVLLENPDRQ